MVERSYSTSAAAGLVLVGVLTAAGASAAEFKTTYAEIVEAAKHEPPVQWCNGMGPDESQPLVDGFVALFPDIPEPNDFECFGEQATQRVIAEWVAGAPQVDVLNVDTEILETLNREDQTHVQDWSVFDGTPVEVDERYISYEGRFINVGNNHRVIWFNPSIISREEAPKSFAECADPKYKGILAMDVRPTFFEMMEEAGGPWSDEDLRKWAAGIAANEPLWTRGGSHNFQVLSSGERGLNCGQQLHNLFRGGRTDPNDPNAVVQAIIPKRVIIRGYQTTAIAPEPLAPNAAILFGAYLGSDLGQEAIAKANPGYSSPFIEGSYSNKLVKEAGAEVLRQPPEVIAKVSDKLNKIVLTEWGFPSPVPSK